MAAIILDRHLKIQNENELIDYLYDMIGVNYGYQRLDMDILPPEDEDDETLIVGWYDVLYFEICFVPGKYLILSTSASPNLTEDDQKEVGQTKDGELTEPQKREQILQRILEPLMWREPDAESVAPKVDGNDFIRPIYDVFYTQLGMHKIMWDTFDPEQSMKNIMFEKTILKEGMKNLNIHHPLYQNKSFKKYFKLGDYAAGMSQEDIDKIDAKTELELYLAIKEKRNEIMEICPAVSAGDEDAKRDLIVKNYQLQYLLQCVGRNFGIKVNSPNYDYVKPTAEITAWELWWGQSMTQMMTTQAYFDKVMIGKFGFDPAFRPSGSYKDFLPEAQKIIETLNIGDEPKN